MNKNKGFILFETIAYISLILLLFLFFYSFSNTFVNHYKKTSLSMNLQENGEVVERFFKSEMKVQGNVEMLFVKNKGLITYDDYDGGEIICFFYTNTYLKDRADIYETKIHAFKIIESSQKLILCKNLTRVTSNITSLVGYEVANHIDSIEIEKLDGGKFFLDVNFNNMGITYNHKFHLKNSKINH